MAASASADKPADHDAGILDGTAVQDEGGRERARSLSLSGGQPPTTLPGYRILRQIGEGKYGTVWLARELNTGKHVAIKFYTHRRGVDWSLLGREVEKLAVLYTSRNIVGLLSVGWDHDPPFYVMEYLPNGSLATRLEHGSVPTAEAVRVATRVCQALVHAHGSGILHCDLKPANVLLDQDQEPRLCDFGQSRLADEQSHALGTLFYMAPEQADLKGVPDARWDVYALGALLYHMLVGQPPYRSEPGERQLKEARSLEERLAIYRRIVRSSPRPNGHRQYARVDAALAEIIDRCLAVDPTKRFANAQAVLDRLRTRAQSRARRPILAIGLLLPLALLGGLTPVAVNAMRDAVHTARDNVTSRALDGNALSVTLLAEGLRRELQQRLGELANVAADENLREEITKFVGEDQRETPPSILADTVAEFRFGLGLPLRLLVSSWPDNDFIAIVERVAGPGAASRQSPWQTQSRTALWSVLDRRRQALVTKLSQEGRSPDVSWFLCDPEGFQRWRNPRSQKSQEENYRWRDYFHGLDREFPEDEVPAGVKPVDGPHISLPYLSTTSKQFSIALSAPVRDTNNRRIIGVIARTLDLGNLLQDYSKSLAAHGIDLSGRELALMDSRGWKLLAHQGIKEADELTELEFEKLVLAPVLQDQLAEMIRVGNIQAAQDSLDRTDDYVDPLGVLNPREFGGGWLAAFSTVGNTSWVAVVQEDRDEAWRPVEKLRSRLLMSGLAALIVVGVLLAGMWGLIIAMLSERGPRWLKGLSGRTHQETMGTTLLSLSTKGSESD